MTDSARFSWTVLLPVKVLAHAKSRLAALAGDRRGELALALASDTVVAAARCPGVARVIVVTSDPVAGPLLGGLGAIIVPDEPADRQATRMHRTAAAVPANRGIQDLGVQDSLNAALRHGAEVAARRWPGTGLAALTADLPALDPAELSAALRAAASVSRVPAFVPDAADVGTTLYAVPPGGEFRPLFGGASRARHAAAGATELSFDHRAGLRRDVDTPDDLRTVLTLGAGRYTRAAAADLFTDV
jgi:2-phospho-L-lactate/phosphoenolpyruvate guanylyltransferase